MSVAAILTGRLGTARRSRSLQLAFSLTLLTLSSLFFAEFLGVGTDELADRLESRKMVSEALAVQLATLASLDNEAAIEHSISETVRRNRQVLAARLSDARGQPLAEYGEVARIDTRTRTSTLDQVIVPIRSGSGTRGELHIAFEPHAERWQQTRYFVIVLLAAFVGYWLFLRRALVQLDPGSVVPKRVSTAFDMFSEGVIVLDSSLHLLLANKAAVEMMGDGLSSPVGRLIDDWPWRADDDQPTPWAYCLQSGHDVSGQPLRLGEERPRRFMVSCGVIDDGGDGVRGMLITFDDITELEERNLELSSTLSLVNKKNEELESLANLDPLTGLLNRRALMEAFDDALERTRRSGQPLACIMLDIDHFKLINDTYGHGVGDEAICAVATTLERRCREHDRIGRYGGEEYVVLLPDTEAAEAMVIAEKIRLAVGKLCDEPSFPIETMSVSIGVDELGGAEDTATALIERADQALYAAKQGGRDRAVLYGTEILPGTEALDGADGTQDAGARVSELESLLDQRERDLARLRDFDRLTGSPLRSMFVEAVGREIERTRRIGKSLCVMAFEITDLPRIRASYGPRLVDELVIRFSDRLRDGLRRSDVVAKISPEQTLSRIAANEYAVLLIDLDDSRQTIPVLTRLRRLLSSPFELGGQRFYLGVRVGVVPSSPEGDKEPRDAEGLLDAALLARHMTANGGDKFSYSFASAKLDEMSREYLELESSLYEAVNDGDLEMHYQPKYDLARRRITGLEALVRWTHPERGPISPVEFIPVAEASGLIHDIFDFVLGRTLRDLQHWRADGHEDIRISVNISAVQLREPTLVFGILEKIRIAGSPPSSIEVELTETAVIDSPNRARIALEQLREAGVSISMDDFGTGYTSLALLADLPLDVVKLDRSFITAMSDSRRSEAVVSSVIGMAHALNLKVVGEGVETADQLERLQRIGCNEIQGYLISRPVPAASIDGLLDSQRSSEFVFERVA